ncbi:MAG: hypothetical protein ACRCVT_05020, partial [Leadbetterella sp.]
MYTFLHFVFTRFYKAFLILCWAGGTLFAQEPIPYRDPVKEPSYTPEQTQQMLGLMPVNNNSAQNTTTSAGTYTGNRTPFPGSGETASALQFKDSPVNISTGAMSYAIPLYTLQEGGLQVPISLNYNGTGVKLDEVASWAGIGWNLQAGGSMTRQVRGIPDEGLVIGNNTYRGYYLHGFGGNGTSPIHDTESDYYFFNINGATYKAVYIRTGSDPGFKTIPSSDLKITVDHQYIGSDYAAGKFESFTVIDPSGTKYFFDRKEKSYEVEKEYIRQNWGIFNTLWTKENQTTTWHLKKMTSAYGQEIDFEYFVNLFSYYKIAEHGTDNLTLRNNLIADCPNTNDLAIKQNRVFVLGLTLAAIKGVNTKIEFNKRGRVCGTFNNMIEYCYDTTANRNREDLDFWAATGGVICTSRKLIEMQIMENTTTPKDTLVYKFSYDFMRTANSSGGINVGSWYNKMILKKVQMPDKSFIRFRYKNDSYNFTSRDKLSYGVDHWGSPNGVSDNNTKLGLIGDDANRACTRASNRNNNIFYAIDMALDSVVYSTGKWYNFSYESHFSANYVGANNVLKPIGGLRIQFIHMFDPISNIKLTKSYNYITANGTSSGFLKLKPTYTYSTRHIEIGCNSGMYDRLMGEIGIAPVNYSRVEETTINATNQSLGKTVYHYNNGSETEVSIVWRRTDSCRYILPPPPNLPPTQECFYSYFREPYEFKKINNGTSFDPYEIINIGNLLKTEIFNQNADSLEVNTYTYENVTGVASERVARLFNVNTRILGVCCGDYYLRSYWQHFDFTRLLKVTTRSFQENGQNPISSQVEYVYKDQMPQSYKDMFPGKHNQVCQTKTRDAQGRESIQQNLYVADFGFGQDTVLTRHNCQDPYGIYACDTVWTVYNHVPRIGSKVRAIYELKLANVLYTPVE